jgi:hypothetical protein
MSDITKHFKDVVVFDDFKLRILLESAKSMGIEEVSVKIFGSSMRENVRREDTKLYGFRILTFADIENYTWVIFRR